MLEYGVESRTFIRMISVYMCQTIAHVAYFCPCMWACLPHSCQGWDEPQSEKIFGGERGYGGKLPRKKIVS